MLILEVLPDYSYLLHEIDDSERYSQIINDTYAIKKAHLPLAVEIFESLPNVIILYLRQDTDSVTHIKDVEYKAKSYRREIVEVLKSIEDYVIVTNFKMGLKSIEIKEEGEGYLIYYVKLRKSNVASTVLQQIRNKTIDSILNRI